MEQMKMCRDEEKSALIERHWGLCKFIARKFQDTGVEVDDLASIGTIGLIKAVDTFDPHKNVKLVTYASKCIENEIRMHLRKKRNEPFVVSLDEPLPTDVNGSGLTWWDTLSGGEDENFRHAEDEVEKELISEVIDRLDGKEQIAIKVRFGFGISEDQIMTQKEAAELFGISQSYFSREERWIMKRLRYDLAQVGF